MVWSYARFCTKRTWKLAIQGPKMVAQYITVTESDPVRKKVDFFETRA